MAATPPTATTTSSLFFSHKPSRPNKIPSLFTSFCTSSVYLQLTRLPACAQFAPLLRSMHGRRWHFSMISFFAARFFIRLTISMLFFYFAYHQNIVRTPSRFWRAKQTERNLNFQWSSRWFDYSEHTRHTSTRLKAWTIAEFHRRCDEK